MKTLTAAWKAGVGCTEDFQLRSQTSPLGSHRKWVSYWPAHTRETCKDLKVSQSCSRLHQSHKWMGQRCWKSLTAVCTSGGKRDSAAQVPRKLQELMEVWRCTNHTLGFCKNNMEKTSLGAARTPMSFTGHIKRLYVANSTILRIMLLVFPLYPTFSDLYAPKPPVSLPYFMLQR